MNEFEKELSDWGAIIIKFWVQIDKDTQLERFTDRQNNPEKRFVKLKKFDKSPFTEYFIACSRCIS